MQKKVGYGSRPPLTKPAEEERRGRLRPGGRRAINTAVPGYGGRACLTGTARRLLRLAKQVSRAAGPKRSSRTSSDFSSRQFKRRTIVNVRYANSKVRGGWKAHGRYVERESAAGGSGRQAEDRLGMARERSLDELAAEWQAEGDERLFKIIISPEDGAKANFRETAEQMIEALEVQVGSRVQWAGIVHRNTDHPHAHLIVRGVKQDGSTLTIPRSVVKSHLREAVQESLTKQLGFRTIDDVRRERQAETTAFRVTSIDRALARSFAPQVGHLAGVTPQDELQQRRLQTLEKMGLANCANGRWQLKTDFQKQLQQMKDLQDRARTLFQSGVPISDPHAPMEYVERSRRLIGRVLLTSEDEKSGQLQTAFETIDGRIVIAKHDSTLRGAWVRGDLKPGNIVSIDSLKRDPNRLYAASVGEEKTLLSDEKALDGLARRIRNMSLVMTESDKGWMGQLTKALGERQREQEAQL